VFSLAAAIVLCWGLGSLACALVFLAKLRIPVAAPAAGIVLILPATGLVDNLGRLLAALSRQTLRDWRLIIAVEASDDPAFGRAAALAAAHSELAIDIVVAGVCDHRGQKCTNILAALGRLTPADRFVVMLDADICPQPWWLAALVGPLAAGRAEVVNGYRWMVPQPPHLAPLLIADLDRRLAVLPRFAPAAMLWGGSLAMTREALEIVDLSSTFERQVVEDMPIADRLAETRLRLLTRRALRVPTPLRGSWRDMWAFGRRQSQFVRIYRPRLWLIAGGMASADLFARIVLVRDLFAADSVAALAILACAAALGSATAELRFAIGRRIGAADGSSTRVCQHLLVWATLPIGAFYVGLIWAGAVVSPVRWAHVRYALDRSGRVYAARRYPYERGREG
jgi:hypothetical protein